MVFDYNLAAVKAEALREEAQKACGWHPAFIIRELRERSRAIL